MKLPDAPIIEKVRQWLAYADEDLRVARYGFSIPENPPFRVITFHAQQCAEKCVKAYLVFLGVDFPFTHSLRRLVDLCAAAAPWAEELRDAEELSPYAITARYPGEDLVVSEAGARRAVEIAERVQEIIRNAFRQEGFEAGPENKPA
jgi:HEPN domain-containing protein